MLEWFDLGKTATRGFIDDLVAGKSAAEALGNVFQQLGNKLLDLGLNSLFGTGQGSSPFGLLGKAFGFASGGYTGAGGKYEPAGVVHRGEYVFDKAATSRLGVSNLERLRKGYAQGGFVGMPGSMPASSSPSISAPISIQIDATGADAAGLARVEQRLAQLRAELPGLTVKAVRDAGKRGVKM
jgi:phage-related minor tail protein